MSGKQHLYISQFFCFSLAVIQLISRMAHTTPEVRKRRLDEAFEAAPKNEPITIKTLAEIADVSQDTMRRYLKEFEDEYMVYRGTVQARPLLSGTSQVP